MEVDRIDEALVRLRFFLVENNAGKEVMADYDVVRNACTEYIGVMMNSRAVEAEIEGGGLTWWYVCGECHSAIDRADKYCRECGRKIIWQKAAEENTDERG